MQATWWVWLVHAIGSTFCHVHSIMNSHTTAKKVKRQLQLIYLRLRNNAVQSMLILTVNSHPFLSGCRCDFRMTAIMMKTAITDMPTSTQLARTEPTTMTIEIPFDDEPCSGIQSTDELASDVVCFTHLMVLLLVVGWDLLAPCCSH